MFKKAAYNAPTLPIDLEDLLSRVQAAGMSTASVG